MNSDFEENKSLKTSTLWDVLNERNIFQREGEREKKRFRKNRLKLKEYDSSRMQRVNVRDGRELHVYALTKGRDPKVQ